MKKIKLIIAAVAVMSLVSSSAVYADGFAPGEGAYVGAFFGQGAGLVQARVVTNPNDTSGTPASPGGEYAAVTAEITDGGIGLSGIQGGVWLGYGYKVGDFNIGFEMDWAGTDEEFKLTASPAVETSVGTTVSEVSADIDWTAGGGARIGYYLNDDTLLSVKGGIAASKFEVTAGSDSDDFYGGGPRVTAAVDSRIAAVDPNLSLRMEYNYTDYMTAPVHAIGGGTSSSNDARFSGANTEVSGEHMSGRIGLVYSFFDVNSLF